jgi:hypothetical protein
MRWERHIARIGDMRSSYDTVVGKSYGKRPLMRLRSIWDHRFNIAMVK